MEGHTTLAMLAKLFLKTRKVFNLLVLIFSFQNMSQMKAYNFLHPIKIAIQHLNIFFTVKSAQTRAIYL